MDPYVKNPSAAANPGPFREGDRVRFLRGFGPVEGLVIEDRGNLGVGGGGSTAFGFRLTTESPNRRKPKCQPKI